MEIKKQIALLKQMECECGYHFETIDADKHLYSGSEYMWMQHHKGKYVICPGCKKKIFNMENVEHYLRKQKLKKIMKCQ